MIDFHKSLVLYCNCNELLEDQFIDSSIIKNNLTSVFMYMYLPQSECYADNMDGWGHLQKNNVSCCIKLPES